MLKKGVKVEIVSRHALEKGMVGFIEDIKIPDTTTRCYWYKIRNAEHPNNILGSWMENELSVL